MSRAGRLFQLMDALRGNRRPVTAAKLAEQLGVSERTIYRDMQTLAELGAPLEGEAGVGYMLRAGFFLPPLMFGADELEALVLGARWVRRQGDEGLSKAASSALAKIATASPKDLRDSMADTSLWVPIGYDETASEAFVQPARLAIRQQHKMRISYRDEAGRESQRIVWPFALAYMEGKRLLAAWCEMRDALRHFRIDRISAAEPIAERYPTPRHALLQAWRAENNIREDM
ncbi:helix-turn-helix transcriptional regulator [Pseudoduganella namucuonensis]|uniref:Predicted DNA-binding transcriptional regulator YafY, contains an HTH and WYL domains n=1 Tax=Pseudoduganella namucuonensis TaxID=1035707 RepID=A0A1I7L9I0_9BURK|nr:YafY family protein [Pseudoduganella namucuonensis]SFV06383.1 Predicted DNA-binding transcriptional regulator YafY, contains an HTH and WYL domains [Pseudoduganella namucuonensis]